MTKLAKIMEIAEPLLKSDDLPVEVEYEDGTISQYPVGGVEVTPSGLLFYLGTKHVACLAPEKCGVDGGGCCQARRTPTSVMCVQADAREPQMSIPQHADSTTVTS